MDENQELFEASRRPSDMGVMTRPSEHDLIDACLGGQVDAFGDLIQPYQDRLFNTLYRLLGSQEDAAEILQEALIRAFRALKTYQGGSSIYTWLYRISVNVALSSKRKQRLRSLGGQTSLDSAPCDVPDRDEENRPGRSLELKERQELVQKALAEVGETYRVVLILKDIEGLRYEEIGDILDIPVGTVRSRLHRARAEMREKLQPMLEQDLL